MSIRIYAHCAAKLQGRLMPAPIEVEAPGVGIDLYGDTVLGTCAKDFLDVYVVTRPAQQLPAGDVTQDGGTWVCNGSHDPIRLLVAAELEPAMDARDHEIEARQHVVPIIQQTVGKNFRLNPLENTEAVPITLVQAIRFSLLFGN